MTADILQFHEKRLQHRDKRLQCCDAMKIDYFSCVDCEDEIFEIVVKRNKPDDIKVRCALCGQTMHNLEVRERND